MNVSKKVKDSGKYVSVSLCDLSEKIDSFCLKYTTKEHSETIVRMIAETEKMNVPSHGLHYFLEIILPLLKKRELHECQMEVSGNFIYVRCRGGIGYSNVLNGLRRAGQVASKKGIAVATFKMPGKVGALRTYCKEFMDNGQLIVLFKNTAPTMGLPGTKRPVLGTNPLAIGLPETEFIYDSSMSSVSTNTVRLMNKKKESFDCEAGFDRDLQLTSSPDKMLDENGGLLPFSFGPFWFKSFFLGVAIEAICSLAGGKSGERVKCDMHRLYSREGMLGILIDKKAFPDYDNYYNEIGLMLSELKGFGLKIPGVYNKDVDEVRVFEKDWEALTLL